VLTQAAGEPMKKSTKLKNDTKPRNREERFSLQLQKQEISELAVVYHLIIDNVEE